MNNKCKGSGERVVLAWPPDGEYEGGVICSVCAVGMSVLSRTVKKATYEDSQGRTYPCFTGVVRAHKRVKR